MRFTLLRLVLVAGLLLALTGCWKKSGEAIVLEKEFIAPAEVSTTSSPTTEDEKASRTEEERPLKPNEIVVDGYVMDKALRGTSKDPRALSNPQWQVRVRLAINGREMKVLATQEQFNKLQAGDRLHVSYREGKYTGTIWSAEIE